MSILQDDPRGPFDPEFVRFFSIPPGFPFLDRATGFPCRLILNWAEHPEYHEWVAILRPGIGWCLWKRPNGPELDALRKLIQKLSEKLSENSPNRA